MEPRVRSARREFRSAFRAARMMMSVLAGTASSKAFEAGSLRDPLLVKRAEAAWDEAQLGRRGPMLARAVRSVGDRLIGERVSPTARILRARREQPFMVPLFRAALRS